MLLEKLALSKGENEFFDLSPFISPYFLTTRRLFRGCERANFR